MTESPLQSNAQNAITFSELLGALKNAKIAAITAHPDNKFALNLENKLDTAYNQLSGYLDAFPNDASVYVIANPIRPYVTPPDWNVRPEPAPAEPESQDWDDLQGPN